MNKYLILLILLFSTSIFSQKTNLVGKLPWVNGNLPSNSLNYNYKVVSGNGDNLTIARNESIRELITDLASEKGVTVSSETILKTQTIENDNNQTFNADFKRNTKISQDGFEAVFTRIDEYYETNNGIVTVWRLYVIGESSSNIFPYVFKYASSSFCVLVELVVFAPPVIG